MYYQWLYFSENYIGEINWIKLKQFYNSSFDHDLGWEPRPNTSKKESYGFNKEGYLCFDQDGLRRDSNKIYSELDIS